MMRKAINQVSIDRATLGAIQSRLEFTNTQLMESKENLSAAVSRIADVDVAEETTRYARNQILVQMSTQMLREANNLSKTALDLLR
jgi:flagellin